MRVWPPLVLALTVALAGLAARAALPVSVGGSVSPPTPNLVADSR